MARGGGRGGGGGGGGRDRGPPSPGTLLSKKLSWLLRHGAEKEGLTLGKGGYVNLNDVLTNRTIRSLQPRPTLAEIQSIVATNEKQRFSLIHISSLAESSTASPPPSSSAPDTPPSQPPIDTDPSHYLIRANQGHSLAIADTSDLLTPITVENAPRIVVHGTRRQTWQEISASGGLKPMGRTHVHFATGVPVELAKKFEVGQSTGAGEDVAALGEQDGDGVKGKEEKQVLSGMRNSSTLLIYLDLRRAMDAGVKFFLSENGVVLSEGDAESGMVSTEFFQCVVCRGGKVIWRDGKVVE